MRFLTRQDGVENRDKVYWESAKTKIKREELL